MPQFKVTVLLRDSQTPMHLTLAADDRKEAGNLALTMLDHQDMEVVAAEPELPQVFREAANEIRTELDFVEMDGSVSGDNLSDLVAVLRSNADALDRLRAERDEADRPF